LGNRKRVTTPEYTRNTFYQLPKFLFDEEFDKMSGEAKILYALLHDEMERSIYAGNENKHGEPFIIISRQEMGDMLHVSINTVTKLVNELKKHELLEEERRGQGLPNVTYLLQVEKPTYQNRKICDSRVANIENQGSQSLGKLQYNNKTKNNKTISIKTVPGKAGKKERKKEEDQGSFVTEEFFDLALKRSMETIKDEKQ
jgi:DNA-binding transcriptional regulator YhcF (GntR family)